MLAPERTSLLVEPRPPVDSDWNDRLRSLAAEPIYDRLSLSSAESDAAKTAFINSGFKLNPDLGPRHTDLSEVSRTEGFLLKFKDDLLADQALDPDVRQGYRWRVNELIAKQRMLRAAATGDKRRYEQYNYFIYGRPDKDVFANTADWFRSEAHELLRHDNESVREAAERVLQLVPDLGGDRAKLLPDENTFQKIRELHYKRGGHYALLFAGVELPEKGPVKPDIGEPILEQVRRNLGADEYEIVASASKTWSVSHNPKELRRPAEYSMPLKRFVGLGPGHEWTHVLERINGDRGALRLSGYGLDRYENRQ